MSHLITILLLCFNLQSLQLQPPAENGGAPNVQGLKIAYLTRKLSLSIEEAQKFWPVYFAYGDELKDLRKQVKESQNVLQAEEKILNLKKKYSVEFKKILGSEERANKVFLADMEFGNEIKKVLMNRQKLREKIISGGVGNDKDRK